MSNPMLQMLSRATAQAPQPNINNPIQLIQQFAQFKQLIMGRNPEVIVKKLLETGEMTSNQFEELKKMAIPLKSILK